MNNDGFDFDPNAKNSSFDPYNQNFTVFYPDGVNTATLNFSLFSRLRATLLQTAAVYGVQLGMAAVLMCFLGLLTRAEKRRSFVFVFNMAALIIYFIRAVLQLCTIGGSFFDPYNFALGVYPNLTSTDTNISVLAEITTLLGLTAVEISLVLQLHIVCCTIQRPYRLLIDMASGMVVFVTVGLRFANAVVDIQWSILSNGNYEQFAVIDRLSTASSICSICSIFLFSAAFTGKLAFAIHSRRKLGMKQFGPMQIIFVMGCQTLIIPAIFGIVSYHYIKTSQVYSMAPMMVAIFLPLSAIWASTETKNSTNIAAPEQWRQQNLKDSRMSDRDRCEKMGLSSTGTEATLINQSRNESFSGTSPTSKKMGMGHSVTAGRYSDDLDMQDLNRYGGRSIYCGHQFDVSSEVKHDV